jgi:hypothetical protein
MFTKLSALSPNKLPLRCNSRLCHLSYLVVRRHDILEPINTSARLIVNVPQTIWGRVIVRAANFGYFSTPGVYRLTVWTSPVEPSTAEYSNPGVDHSQARNTWKQCIDVFGIRLRSAKHQHWLWKKFQVFQSKYEQDLGIRLHAEFSRHNCWLDEETGSFAAFNRIQCWQDYILCYVTNTRQVRCHS